MLLFVDSMSHYTDAFLADKWDVRGVPIQPGCSLTQSLTSGRFGNGGITYIGSTGATTSGVSGSQAGYVQKNYSGGNVIIVGLAVQQTLSQAVRGARLLTFLDSATTQVGIDIMPSGQLRVIRSTSPGGGIFLVSTSFTSSVPNYTVLGTSTGAISSNAFDFLEFKITFHPTTGSVEVRRNTTEAFYTLSNVNTAISGSENAASVLLGGYGGVGTGALSTTVENHYLNAIVSDFHLLDTNVNGSDPNDPVDFIGDRHWEVVLPTADSTPLEWTPNGSANHWENVDDINPPSTAADNNTLTIGNRDALLFQDLTGPVTASVLLSYTMYLQKDTGGAVGVSGLMVSPAGGTQGNGTEFQVPSPVAFRQSFLCTDPAAPGTDPLTVQVVNDGAHGYERTS